MSNFSRRDFLKTGALSSIIAGTGLAACTTSGEHAGRWKGHAKNVIFMVSDGMSTGTLTMADHMKRVQFGNASKWIDGISTGKFRRSLMDMASLDSLVTDSAASASSWGCGHRINNGSVNMGPNDEVYTPLVPIFRNAGKKTGLVTTTRITHATPASFVANVRSRGEEDTIATQMLERRPDVLYGGGARHFDPNSRSDGRDLFAEFTSAGYKVVRTKEELKNTDTASGQVLGLFNDDHLPYTVDHNNIDEFRKNIPTLAELTEDALKRLQGSDGFLLQVEGGRVDHAAHGNDAASLIYDQIAFDDAIGVVLEFASSNPDTLVIITTDHGNANPALNGAGSNYTDSNPQFESLQKTTRSFEWMSSQINENTSVSRLREMVEAYTTHAITTDQATALRNAVRRQGPVPYSRMNGVGGVLGLILANYTAVSFTSNAHTSDFVELAAIGPGSEAITPFVKNTELFDLCVQAAGVSVRV